MRRLLSTMFIGALALTACSQSAEEAAPSAEGSASSDNVINVYSSRHYDVDKEVYKRFEEATGIKVNVVDGKSDEIIERVQREKDNPKADVLLTVGAESLYPLHEADALEDAMTSTIEENIPENFRGDYWTGLTSRARVIAYNKDNKDAEKIKTYDDLTKDDFKGKVIARSSSSSYNQALLASFIELNGEDAAKEWAEGVVANFARDPEGNDRDQAKAVAAGEADYAIMNSYYLARMLNSSDAAEKEAAEKVALIFPEHAHLNISYGAMLKGAANKDNAKKFLEFLTSEEIQELYATENGEFPLNPKAPLPEIQKSWGEFSVQDLDFEELGKYRDDATKIFDEVGWK